MREPADIREIPPCGRLKAIVTLPGSKSHTQRALVIAALAEGTSFLKDALRSEDTHYLIEALRALGAVICEEGADLRVEGTQGAIRNPGRPIHLGNNGTALRFLASLVCLGPGPYALTGDARLCERPIRPLLDALANLGAQHRYLHQPGCAPFELEAPFLKGGKVTISGSESSQYISSIMLSAPYARERTTVKVSGPMLSRPYVDMTVKTMERFGVKVKEEKPNQFIVPSGCSYRAQEYVIETDVSSASYFFLAAALCGGSVEAANLSPSSIQGDIGFLDILEKAGCSVLRQKDSVEVIGRPLLAGDMTLAMGSMPDMVPTVAVLAACRPGRTTVSGVPHLRLKESDRLAALAAELGKTGVRVEELGDGLIIEGGSPKGAEIETYNDHRIAMSFAILGLVAGGMKIRNPACVKKSFPGFWEKLEELYF